MLGGLCLVRMTDCLENNKDDDAPRPGVLVRAMFGAARLGKLAGVETGETVEWIRDSQPGPGIGIR